MCLINSGTVYGNILQIKQNNIIRGTKASLQIFSYAASVFVQ